MSLANVVMGRFSFSVVPGGEQRRISCRLWIAAVEAPGRSARAAVSGLAARVELRGNGQASTASRSSRPPTANFRSAVTSPRCCTTTYSRSSESPGARRSPYLLIDEVRRSALRRSSFASATPVASLHSVIVAQAARRRFRQRALHAARWSARGRVGSAIAPTMATIR
jgi:hypothetical protein